MDIKSVALKAAKSAGKILLKEYAKFNRGDIRLKSHHEIITKADLLSEEIIIREIKKNFPSHCIISEERGEIRGTCDYHWHIDPIDGTTNFSMHNPLWSISLACSDKDEIIFGLIFAPALGELYWAEKGKGAYLNGKKIHVSSVDSGKVINTFCHGSKLACIKQALKYYNKQKLAALDCRQLGSAAIELAYVACGRVESFVAPGANDWDVAAGTLIVREAGGKVTNFSDKTWRLGDGDIAASNNKVHQQILRALKK